MGPFYGFSWVWASSNISYYHRAINFFKIRKIFISKYSSLRRYTFSIEVIITVVFIVRFPYSEAIAKICAPSKHLHIWRNISFCDALTFNMNDTPQGLMAGRLLLVYHSGEIFENKIMNRFYDLGQLYTGISIHSFPFGLVKRTKIYAKFRWGGLNASFIQAIRFWKC